MCNPKSLVFIDETGLNTKMARLYGRALRGQRCVDHVPYGHWHTSTFIAGLRQDHLSAPMLFDGPMNAATFLGYVREVLSPTLNQGDIVICDNLASHKVYGVKEAIEAKGAQIRYLPPYSPDLNPIEMAFSKLKAHIKKKACHTFDLLVHEVDVALNQFNPSHCANFIKHAKYASEIN